MPMLSVPAHIAIIMDGNGRWAKQKSKPRLAGHRAGLEAVRRVIKLSRAANIQVLSLFAFSSENWQRPSAEVNHLMSLFLHALNKEVDLLCENQIQLRFIGARDKFSPKLIKKIKEVERLTEDNAAMVLLIAVDYGGKWDITQSVSQIAAAIEKKELTAADISAELISAYLSFSDLPDPDLFIRTSGELRISNFMLWQLAYTEFYFTDIYWPDFDEQAFNLALAHYANRERRFGEVK